MSILVSACLASVVVLTVVLTSYATGIKKDFDTKMRSVVDQVNTTQYYQYELEKKSYDKLNSIDNSLNNVRSKYLPRDEIKDRLPVDTVDANTVRAKTTTIGNQLQFKDGISMSAADKKLNINLPLGGAVGVKDAAGKTIMNLDDKANFDHTKVNKLQLGDKFLFSGVGTDNWMRVVDPVSQTYKGGMIMSELNVRDNTLLTGNTKIDKLAVNNSIDVLGGRSEHNPGLRTFLPFTDGKNYIRGDTELRGNNTNMGDLTVKRDMTVDNLIQANKIQAKSIKLGSIGGAWWNESPLAVTSTAGKTGASFGSTLYSHLPFSDGNTYIRPGIVGGAIKIGDRGTSMIELGDLNTTTTVGGKLCVKDVCLTKEEVQKIKQTADDNLLQLQQALQQKLAEAQVQIEELAAIKANEQIAVYKVEQETRELSLQQQIYEITQALAEIKVKIGM